MLKKIVPVASVYKDDSPVDAEGYYIDTDKMRPWNGRMETIGGWELASSSTLVGICRSLLPYADNASAKYVAFGTHLRLELMDADGTLYDLTPVITRGELSSPFSTTISSTTVTVAHNSHGLVENQRVKFANATAVGGLTIDGPYVVLASPAANTYTITASSAATSTAGPGGGTVDYEYCLAPGNVDSLFASGYGTGGYGTGGYGSAGTLTDLVARTYSLAQWGQNLLANPRGGAIFEFAPNLSATELVTQGDFSAATGWSAGTAWSIGGGNTQASVSSGSLARSVTLRPGAWHLLDMDVTRAAGSVQPYWSSNAIGSAISAAGTYKVAFFSGSGGAVDLRFTGTGFTGTLDNVSVKVLTTAHQLPNAPSTCSFMFVTPDGFCVALGCPDTNSNFDPMLVKWSDRRDGLGITQWTADPTLNLAGSYRLLSGSRMVAGIPGDGENLLLSDTTLYSMKYTGDPDSVFRIDPIATGCGLAGPNAICQINGQVFWVSPQLVLYQYVGGKPVPVVSRLIRDVRDNRQFSQNDKIVLVPNSAHSEVWMHYQDGRDGSEVSRYIIHNITDGSEANGTFDRTSWADAGVFEHPISVDADGSIWYQEKGDTEDGAARSWSSTTAFFDLGDGDSSQTIKGFVPDHDDLRGGYSVTLKTRHTDVRGTFERTFGPFMVTAATRRVPVRAVGQQCQIIREGNSAPAWYRDGAFKLDLQPSGRRR